MAPPTYLLPARNAVQDPTTPPETLTRLAQAWPTLWPDIAAHERATPALLEWLAAQGDDRVKDIVTKRQAGGAGADPAESEATAEDVSPYVLGVASGPQTPSELLGLSPPQGTLNSVAGSATTPPGEAASSRSLLRAEPAIDLPLFRVVPPPANPIFHVGPPAVSSSDTPSGPPFDTASADVPWFTSASLSLSEPTTESPSPSSGTTPVSIPTPAPTPALSMPFGSRAGEPTPTARLSPSWRVRSQEDSSAGLSAWSDVAIPAGPDSITTAAAATEVPPPQGPPTSNTPSPGVADTLPPSQSAPPAAADRPTPEPSTPEPSTPDSEATHSSAHRSRPRRFPRGGGGSSGPTLPTAQGPKRWRPVLIIGLGAIVVLVTAGLVIRNVWFGPVTDTAPTFVCQVSPANPSDVPPQSPFYDAVCSLAAAGVLRIDDLTAFPEGEEVAYRPGDRATRAAVAVALYRAADLPRFALPGTSPFTDVSTSDPAYRPIAWLEKQGLVAGGTFEPTEPITRATMADWLYTFSGSPTYVPPDESPYSDVSVAHPSYQAITWLADRGVGTDFAGVGVYRPDQPLNRGALALFLDGVLD